MDHRFLLHVAIVALVLSGCASSEPILYDTNQLWSGGNDLPFIGKPAEISFRDGTIMAGVVQHMTSDVVTIRKTDEDATGEYPVSQINRIAVRTSRWSLPAGIGGGAGGLAVGLGVAQDWETPGLSGLGKALFVKPLIVLGCGAVGALIGLGVGGMVDRAASNRQVYAFSPGGSSQESPKDLAKRYVLIRDKFIAEDGLSISIMWKNKLTRLLKQDIIIEPHPLGYRLVVPATAFGE